MIKKESKEKQELVVTEQRTQILYNFMMEALQSYEKFNKGLPDYIFIYRDGLGEPSMMQKV